MVSVGAASSTDGRWQFSTSSTGQGPETAAGCPDSWCGGRWVTGDSFRCSVGRCSNTILSLFPQGSASGNRGAPTRGGEGGWEPVPLPRLCRGAFATIWVPETSVQVSLRCRGWGSYSPLVSYISVSLLTNGKKGESLNEEEEYGNNFE